MWLYFCTWWIPVLSPGPEQNLRVTGCRASVYLLGTVDNIESAGEWVAIPPGLDQHCMVSPVLL